MNNFNLNPQQLAAVNDTEGAVLVIAGAGSGKTRVLTARVCHLIETGVDPYNILAITFTNKAANEMKERIERYIGSQSVWTSTFHSMCARMLRYDADRIGYSTDFTIYTDLESERVVKRVLQDYPQADPKTKAIICGIFHVPKRLLCRPTPITTQSKTTTTTHTIYIRSTHVTKRNSKSATAWILTICSSKP